MPPTVIFGDIRGMEVSEILPILQKYGINRLDSAASYVNGDSEKRLGDAGVGKTFTIDTKVAVSFPNEGALTPEKITKSAKESLDRLKLETINVLYAHAPDHETPVADQAKGFNEVFKKGSISAVGVSNFKPSMVEEWLRIAEKEGYVKPTWYQGQYNLVVRSFENDIFPLLRKEGMKFAAYSPLAGGFLNGNLKRNGTKTGQRFIEHQAKDMYTGFFDQPCMYDAWDKLEAISKSTGISPDELGLRWILHHSAMQDGDILILGASKVHQIENSLSKLQKGPLDEETVKQLDAINTPEVKEAAFKAVNLFTK
ncbi:Oxidoreductase sirO [Pseudocercospora fuligena]|uniref:Oxidoreductase sirO n=1 Tax=Pseudocercospora fuligena TaxID=685502 RepID=A0A8H6VKI1_9PEZI|nr:Oxidoreductase sirO [Pseudocercospora fuligena]